MPKQNQSQELQTIKDNILQGKSDSIATENLESYQQVFAELYQDPEIDLNKLHTFNNNANAIIKDKKFPDFFEHYGNNIVKYQIHALPQQENMTIKECFLIGSHDSGTYAKEFGPLPDSSFDTPFKRIVVKPIAKIITLIPLIKNLITRFGKCQDKTIEKQLNAGVRVFDFRVAEHKDEFVLAHSFVCSPLKQALEALQEFKKNHPDEPIIVNIKPDGGSKKYFQKNHKRIAQNLQDLLQKSLEGQLYEHSEEKHFQDKPLTELEGKIIICAKNFIPANNQDINLALFFKQDTAQEFWPNAQSAEEIGAKLAQITPEDGKYHYVSGALTPDVKYIVSHLSSSVRELSKTVSTPGPETQNLSQYKISSAVIYDFVPDIQSIEARNRIVHHQKMVKSTERPRTLSLEQDRTLEPKQTTEQTTKQTTEPKWQKLIAKTELKIDGNLPSQNQ